MYESTAINTYLGDKFRSQPGVPALVPEAGTRQRGKYEQMVSLVQTEIDAQGLWIHRKHEALAEHFGAQPGAVAHAKAHVQRVVTAVAADLRQSGDFLLGAEFSAADITFVSCMSWSKAIGWNAWMESNDSTDIAHLRSYLTRCQAREAHQRAVAIRKHEQQLSKDQAAQKAAAKS